MGQVTGFLGQSIRPMDEGEEWGHDDPWGGSLRSRGHLPSRLTYTFNPLPTRHARAPFFRQTKTAFLHLLRPHDPTHSSKRPRHFHDERQTQTFRTAASRTHVAERRASARPRCFFCSFGLLSQYFTSSLYLPAYLDIPTYTCLGTYI